jgi:hypothetical protein
LNVLDAAIKTKLVADSGAGGVATYATGGIYQLNAPQGSQFPYVVFQELLDTAGYTFTRLATDHVFYQIKALAKDANVSGPFETGRIMDRVRVVLTDPTLNVTGQTTLYCRFNRSIPQYSEQDDSDGSIIFHKGGIYEIWLSPA